MKDYKARDTHFVEYILNKEEGYGIYYDLEKPVFFQIRDVPQLQEDLKSIQKLMLKYDLSSKDKTTYQSLGHHIFKTLFPFDNTSFLEQNTLVIIPDDALRYLPFEALPTDSRSDLYKSYFVQSTELSYQQSLSLTKQLNQKQRHTSKKLLIIAPSKFKDKSLVELNETKSSIAHFNTYQNTTTLFGQAATKANFINLQEDYEVMHFNTHAGIDTLTQKPWLAFHDQKMNLYDFYGRENQAKLVVLDACKTNDGKQYAGKGVMNLSRGFFYNGSQSVLASLWKVNENSGNQITQNFYANLEQGYSTSKALQNAKLKYLQQSETYKKAPYYWATFTLTGQADTIALPIKSNSLVYILITIGLLLAIFLFYKHHISKR
jgi:CHAT domain-containing protein